MLRRFIYGCYEGAAFMGIVLIIMMMATILAIPFVLTIFFSAWWLLLYLVVIPFIGGIRRLIVGEEDMYYM